MPSHLNVEIKARCRDPQRVLDRLRALGGRAAAVDQQVDTYFTPAVGRLKLRRSRDENHLIHYVREDRAGPRDSRVTLHAVRPEESADLEALLRTALGVLAVVEKSRHVVWIENVKFHVDRVAGLGSFVEVEAIDRTGEIGRVRLLEQCERYLGLLEIDEADLEPASYGDLVLGAG